MIIVELEELHKGLIHRFETLLQGRGGAYPLYFIEHGLDAESLSALSDAVAFGLKASPWLRSEWWSQRFLPLLVCTSELGYEYCGNGTEYWPLVEKRMGRHFDVEMREALHCHFALAAERWRGCRPPDSGWANAFCHIAWPISHAVLPRDLQRPFLESLRALRIQVRAEDDETLHASLRRSAPAFGSTRYLSWLQNREPAVSLARRFLGETVNDDSNALSPEIVDRILSDIRRDQTATRTLRQARTQQREVPQASKTSKPATSTRTSAPPLWANLVLRSQEGRWQLFGELPLLPAALRKSLRQPLQGRWRPRPWEMNDAPPIPPQAILQSSPFALRHSLLAKAPTETPFFAGFEALGLSDDEARLLRSVRFRMERPFLFEVLEGDLARQLPSNRTSDGECLALVATGLESTRPAGVPLLDSSIPGGQVLAVDLKNDQVRHWLGLTQNGSVRSKPSWRWCLPAPLAPFDDPPKFLGADPMALSIESGDSLSVVWKRNGGFVEQCALTEGRLMALPRDEPGRYAVDLRTGSDLLDSYEYEVVHTDRGEKENAVCSLSLSGDGPSREEFPKPRLVKELRQHRLTLEVGCARRLANVPITVRVPETGAVAHETIDFLPARFGPRHGLWSRLLDSASAGVSWEGSDLTLEVRVGNLARSTWRLECETEELWWEPSPSGAPTPVSDADVYETVSRPADRLLDDAVPGESAPPHLLLARRRRDGQTAQFDGMFLTDDQTGWPLELVRPPRLLRQLDDDDRGVGLRRVVELYLQMASAGSNNVVAEWHRRKYAATLRKWILGVCCGARWSHAGEESAEDEMIDPVRCFWREAWLQRAGFPENDLALTDADAERLFEEAADRLRARLPEGWWQGPIPALTDTQGELLDDVFRRAQSRNDFFTPTVRFQKALESACWRLNGSRFADLIQPISGSEDLLELPLLGMSISELQLELNGWRTRHLRGLPLRIAWDGDHLGIWLALLLQPATLRRHAWEHVVNALLSDLPIARAGAFMAWRVEQLERLSSFRAPIARSSAVATEGDSSHDDSAE